jgi:hypothetical protein
MPPESHRDAIAQIRASQKLPPITPPPLPVAIQKRDPKTGAWSASYADGSINPNARKTFDAAVSSGHDVRSLSLPGGLSAGEVAMLGPVGDPPAVANPDQLQPRRVGDKAGPLKDNDVGYLNGQVWTYPVPKKEECGPVKILFSVVEGGRLVFYVGGDRRVPQELFSASFAEDPNANIVATGKGLNQFYWQSASYVFGEIVPTGFSGNIGVRLVDSRLSDPLFIPRITTFTGDGSNSGDLMAGMYVLEEALPGRNWGNVPYLVSHYGSGIFGAAFATSTNFATGIFGQSSLQFNYVIVRRGISENGTAPGGGGTFQRVNPGFELTKLWSGSTSYSSSIDGIPFFGGSGSEGGTTDTPSGATASYAGSHSKYQLMQIGSSGSLIRRGTRSGYTAYDTKSFEEEIVGFSDGSYFNLGGPAMDLIKSKWVSPNYSSIVKGSLWVRDESSPIFIPETQDYVDFKSINLTSGDIAAKRVKIFPAVKPVYKIHSISYTP